MLKPTGSVLGKTDETDSEVAAVCMSLSLYKVIMQTVLPRNSICKTWNCAHKTRALNYNTYNRKYTRGKKKPCPLLR
jgi:hypothetical protein